MSAEHDRAAAAGRRLAAGWLGAAAAVVLLGAVSLALAGRPAATPPPSAPEPGLVTPEASPEGTPPAASTTGVPAEVTLAPSGSITVDTPGAVLEHLDIDGCVDVKADDVVIRRTRIRCGSAYGIRIHPGFTGTLVSDVEIDGLGAPKSSGIQGSDVTVRRTHIHDVGDGIKIGSRSTYEANYVHDLASGDGKHNDGMQASGATDVVIRGNNISHRAQQTSAILLKADLAPIEDILVEGNWLTGGGYTVYSRAAEFATRRVSFVGNHFGRDYVHGIASLRGTEDLEWRDNAWADSGQVLPVGDASTRDKR